MRPCGPVDVQVADVSTEPLIHEFACSPCCGAETCSAAATDADTHGRCAHEHKEGRQCALQHDDTQRESNADTPTQGTFEGSELR